MYVANTNRKWAVQLAGICLVLLCSMGQSAWGAGWLTGWSFRKQITLSNNAGISGSLSNFPLYVRFRSDNDLAKREEQRLRCGLHAVRWTDRVALRAEDLVGRRRHRGVG